MNGKQKSNMNDSTITSSFGPMNITNTNQQYNKIDDLNTNASMDNKYTNRNNNTNMNKNQRNNEHAIKTKSINKCNNKIMNNNNNIIHYTNIIDDNNE